MTIRWAILLAMLSLIAVVCPCAKATNGTALFATSFGDAADTNYDHWPDRWQRATGPKFPPYTNVAIVSDKDASEGRCLRIDLDGGGARLTSPSIGILAKFGYELKIRLDTEKLHHSRVTFSVELFDPTGKRLQVETSKPIANTNGWKEVAIGPFRPRFPEIDRAVLCIEVPRGKRGDLQGRIRIDAVTLERLPSMTVTTGRPCNIYDHLDEVEVLCSLSGIRDQNPEIRFRLLDATSQQIVGQESSKRVDGRLIVEDKIRADDIVGVIGNHPDGYEGSTLWKPKIEEYGFYKIQVEMLRAQDSSHPTEETDYDRQLQAQVITLAVLPPLSRPLQGEFGWTLPVADRPLSFESLVDLLPRVGIHWVKLPVWYPADEPERGEQFVRFAERVSASQIEVVGIIDDPTIEDYASRDPNVPSDVANLLVADSSYWRPHFDHVMTRLSLRLRWWQLGTDRDTSFYGYKDLPRKVLDIRKSLYRFGQDVKLGFGWRWPSKKDRTPWSSPETNPTWDFEQMSSMPVLTARELETNMANTLPTRASRWVLVSPRTSTPDTNTTSTMARLSSPEAETHRHQDRIRDFVQQMVSAKIHGANGIFVANPFTGSQGVMNTDGTPGELLLPWRTTASLLSGTRYLGKIQLPGESTNHIFEGVDGQLVMIVWSHEETTEKLYLGESIEQIDVWGNRKKPETTEGHRVALKVGRLPSFVLGLHPAVTQWRMKIAFDHDRIPSIFSRAHENSIRGKNFFGQGVSGQFSIIAPSKSGDQARFAINNDRWKILPEEGELAFGAHQPFELPIRIALDEATYGDQPVRIDFEIDADRQYQFSVWRHLSVGMGDIQLVVSTHLDDRGQLIVKQQMTNQGGRTADFKCLLYAPPRRRKRTQVVMLGPEENVKIYQYPGGEALVGQVLKLRVEELSGNRVLIHRFKADPHRATPPTTASTAPAG